MLNDTTDYFYGDKPVLNDSLMEITKDAFTYYRNYCSTQISVLNQEKNKQLSLHKAEKLKEEIVFFEKEKRRCERAMEAYRRLGYQIRHYPEGVMLDFSKMILREE